MNIKLTSRTAIVTASTAGIGFACAEGLALAGARVVVNGRGEARVNAAIAAIRAAVPGARLEGLAQDLATAAGVAAFTARFGETDILVNNLGIAAPKPFSQINDDQWQTMFQTNVMSGVRMSRHYLPGMVSRGWGRVIFISSESGVNIPKDMIDYGWTKASQLAISRGLAESVAETGVTVNSVLPGPTRSEVVNRIIDPMTSGGAMTQLEAEKEFLRAMRPTSLLGRFTSCEEVANMVVYACSEQASGTTGAALRVDGGVVRSIV
jgi:NAD(P)-dependent dehydrogenase (short-subunit alcohol dehydrogenase family)